MIIEMDRTYVRCRISGVMLLERGDKIFELQSEYRRAILEFITDSPKRHGEISRELDISPAETTRHLARLVVSDYIEKRPDSTYTISKYGRLLYDQLLNMNYVIDNWDYFEKSELSVIPKEFLSLPVISEGRIISGPLKVAGELFNMTASSTIFLWSMSRGPMEPFIMEHMDKLYQGVDMRFIQQEGEPIPSEFMNELSFRIEFRTCENADFGLFINESRALLILPDSKNRLDYSSGILGESDTFLRWASMLFESYWSEGNYVSL